MKYPESLVFLQDDVVMGTLTVHKDLCFSAALRLPKSIRQREKDEKIERLIQELGVSKVADSRVTNQTHLHLTDYMCNHLQLTTIHCCLFMK